MSRLIILLIGCFFLLNTDPVKANENHPYNAVSWKIALQGVPQFAGSSGLIAGVANHVIIIAGGKTIMEGKAEFSSAIHLFSIGGWSPLGKNTLRLKEKMADAGFAGSAGMLIYAGGENEGGLLKAVRRISFSPDGSVFNLPDLPDLPEAVKNPIVVLDENNLFIIGGWGRNGYVRQFLKLRLNAGNPVWMHLPLPPEGFIPSSAFIQSDGAGNTVFLTGALKNQNSTPVAPAIVAKYNSVKNSWNTEGERISSIEFDRNAALSMGSTYALLGAKSSHADSIYLYNTVTKRISPIDPLPGIASSNHHLMLKNGDGLILISFTANGTQVYSGSLQKFTFFTLWDYGVVMVYLLLTVMIGLRFSGKHQSTDTYFKGDGKIPDWAIGVSILGAQISAISFMSTPAKVYATNWNYFFLSIAVLFIVPVVNKYYIPFYRRLNLTSAYEYLDKRFNYSVRFIASALYILFELGRLAIILILPSIALSVVAGLDVNMCVLVIGLVTLVYTFKGGIKAVIWTDVMQVFVLLGGALLCVLFILFHLPADSSDIYRNIAENDKFKMFDSQLNLSTSNLWVVLVAGCVLNFLPFSTDQTTVQRYLTTKDEKGARKSVRVAAWISIPATILFMGIGTLIYLFYFYHPGEVNITHKSQDSIFPWFVVSQLPSGIRGLVIAGVFAATMSSLSSSLTSASTAFITDFYRMLYPVKGQREYLKAARITSLLIGALAISIALYIINKGVISLWDQYNIFMGLFTAGIGGVFILGIFTQRVNFQGALGGLILSGLAQYLVSKYTNIHFLLYPVISLIVCCVSGYFIGLCFPLQNKSLEGLTVYTQKKEKI